MTVCRVLEYGLMREARLTMETKVKLQARLRLKCLLNTLEYGLMREAHLRLVAL